MASVLTLSIVSICFPVLETAGHVVPCRGRGSCEGVYVGLLVLERVVHSLLLTYGQLSLDDGRQDVQS
jgi:hypothetical protein